MHASFIKSAASAGGFPEDVGAEVAVVGRSNSGKSSAINRITGHGKLARVSKTPGRTQLINFFDLGPGHRLVDLPGYGFARVPERIRQDWGRLIESYFTRRQSLRGLMLTADIRRGLRDSDRTMLDWSASLELPALVLLTKCDKLSRGAAANQRMQVARELGDAAGVLLFSSINGTGADAAGQQLRDWLTGSEAD